MQFCKLGVFNSAYLHVLHVLSKRFARKKNCLKMSKHRNKSIKINTKLKMNKIVKKGLKMKENVAKKKKKKKENRKRKRQRQKKIKTQLKPMVGIYNAAETGAMKLVKALQ